MVDDMVGIKEKVRNFLENKSGLDLQSCFFVVKSLEGDYWDEIENEGSSDDDEVVEDDDFGDVVKKPVKGKKVIDLEEEEESDDLDDDLDDGLDDGLDDEEVPSEVPALKKPVEKVSLVSRPKIKIKGK